jgi:hypothetical protein
VAATKLHTEMGSSAVASGAYLVAYSGMDGTCRSNRAHFIDFLRSMQAVCPTPPVPGAD